MPQCLKIDYPTDLSVLKWSFWDPISQQSQNVCHGCHGLLKFDWNGSDVTIMTDLLHICSGDGSESWDCQANSSIPWIPNDWNHGNFMEIYGNFMEIYGNLWKCWKMLNFKLLLNFESIAMPHFEHNIAQRFSPFALGRSSNNALARCRSSKSPHRIAFRPPVAQGQLGQNS
jgi:hypothetical protein